MKKSFKLILGVTLLEIILVLEIAGVILIQVAKFYRAAVNAEQTADMVRKYQAIVAAMDSLAAATPSGAYPPLSDVTMASTILSIVGSPGMTTPWGIGITVTAAGSACYGSTAGECYNITIPLVPPSVCPLLHAQMASDTHIVNWSPPDATPPPTPLSSKASPCVSTGGEPPGTIIYTYSHTGSYS